MKSILIPLIFLISTFAQSQTSLEIEQEADALHFDLKHEEAIAIRKKLLNNLQSASAIERNMLKLKLSEYHGTNSWTEGLVVLESIKDQILDTNLVSDKFKIEFYLNYYRAVAFANQDWEKSLSIAKAYLNKIENKQITASIKEKTEVVYDIAFIHGQLNQPYDAIYFYDNAANLYTQQGLEQTSDMALLYNNLGFEYSKLSNYKKCNENYILATEIWEKQPNENANYLATAYNNLIYNFIPYGEIKKANYYLAKLKTVANQLDKSDLENIQKVKLSILLNEMKIYNFEKKIKIVEIHHQLINYFDSLQNKEEYLAYYSSAQNMLVNYWIQNKQLNTAETLALNAEYSLKKYHYDEGLLVLYSHLVVLKREKKDYKTAMNYVNKALEISDKTIQGNKAGLLVSKGVIFKEMNNYKEAEHYYNEAQNIMDTQESADIETLSYYTEIANFYLKKYETEHDKKILNRAFLLFKNCINQFSSIYKNGMFNPKLDEYLDTIHEGLLTVALHDSSKRTLVLDYVENSTSKYLWSNFIKNNTSTNLLNVDQNYNTLQNINAQIAYSKSEVQKEKEKKTPDESKLKEINQKILILSSQVEQLEHKLFQSNINFKNLYEPKYSTSEFILSLKNSETVINFCTTKDNIYAIFLNNSGILKIKKIEKREKLYKQINQYNQLLTSKSDTSELNKQLFNALLEELPTTSKQLTIIAKDVLSLLPYETLKFNNLYLLEQYTVNYSSSLTLYSLQKALATRNIFKLAVFNPDYANTSFSELPFAKLEAKFLEAQYKATLFSDELANKRNFLNHINQFNIYHLAMHAEVNNEDENASKLIFKSENLYFSDLFAQELPLDLVVLSACETGYGKNVEGEGILSLSRAFTYSGVAATVHSLWKTPDKQGAEIMQHFYGFLSEGLPKNIALQKAKLKFLESTKAEELKHPYYWAGFVLSGNPSPLVTSSPYIKYGVIGLLMLVFGIFGFLKFRK